MVGHEAEARAFRTTVAALTARFSGSDLSEADAENIRAERRQLRRDWKSSLKRWEEEWWEELIRETKEAEGRGDVGGMYRMLKRLGAREFRRGKVSDAVSLEQFRCQFSSVSAQRHELPWEVLERVVDNLPGELSDVHVDAAEVLGREVSEAEVRVEWGKIRDGAPGEDGVRVSFVRHADLHTQ